MLAVVAPLRFLRYSSEQLVLSTGATAWISFIIQSVCRSLGSAIRPSRGVLPLYFFKCSIASDIGVLLASEHWIP